MKGWYQDVFDCALSPTWVTLKWVMAERVNLYRYVPPPGENIPVYVEPFPVEDFVPTETRLSGW